METANFILASGSTRKAWMIWMPAMDSRMVVLSWPMTAWLCWESFFRSRPMLRIGQAMSGTTTQMMSESFQLMASAMARKTTTWQAWNTMSVIPSVIEFWMMLVS